MAKHHNHFGAIDHYFKEFARICMGTQNPTLCRNLEKALNSEVVIEDKSLQKQMLGDFKDLPREIDPVLLGQPSF